MSKKLTIQELVEFISSKAIDGFNKGIEEADLTEFKQSEIGVIMLNALCATCYIALMSWFCQNEVPAETRRIALDKFFTNLKKNIYDYEEMIEKGDSHE